jgi:hypothetical protein
MLIAVLFIGIGPSAEAQLGSPSTPVDAVAINGTVTTSAVASVSLDNASTIALQARTASSGANVSNTVITINESVDGTYYSGTKFTWTITNTGTTAVNAMTNLTAGAMKYWRFNIENGAVDGVTNTVTIKVDKKPGL